jgi:hypothetical protein
LVQHPVDTSHQQTQSKAKITRKSVAKHQLLLDVTSKQRDVVGAACMIAQSMPHTIVAGQSPMYTNVMAAIAFIAATNPTVDGPQGPASSLSLTHALTLFHSHSHSHSHTHSHTHSPSCKLMGSQYYAQHRLLHLRLTHSARILKNSIPASKPVDEQKLPCSDTAEVTKAVADAQLPALKLSFTSSSKTAVGNSHSSACGRTNILRLLLLLLLLSS